jgi:peptide-methionine (S)-S-oxide reductase
VISYEELLEVFWNNHTPVSRSVSQQYGSVIFYHDEDQQNLAQESKERREEETGRNLATEIVPYSEFWRAEDYHQKYRLRGVNNLMAEFGAMFPDQRSFVDSTATARVNGYVGGNGTLAQVRETIGRLGLSDEGQERLLEIAQRRLD